MLESCLKTICLSKLGDLGDEDQTVTEKIHKI